MDHAADLRVYFRQEDPQPGHRASQAGTLSVSVNVYVCVCMSVVVMGT